MGEANVWLSAHGSTGFPLAFGVFEEYYSTHEEEIKGSRSTIAVIGTTATVCSYIWVLVQRW
jgi:hypothetical protein